MSIEVRCDACGESHRVNTRMAGRSIRCRTCDATMTVPQPRETGSDAAADADDHADSAADVDERGIRTNGPDHDGVPDHRAAANSAAANSVAATAAATSNRFASPDEDGSGSDGAGQTKTVLFHDVDDDVPLRREKRPEEELDMTPMVDVTFLLLIFFMVTASFSLQKSIQVPRQTTDLPSASPVEEETDELDPVELEIDEFGGFYVITADFEEETPGKQNLIRTLKRVVGQTTEAMQLKIRVHELAKLQALVDGMDAGTIAGFTEIEVSQVENF